MTAWPAVVLRLAITAIRNSVLRSTLTIASVAAAVFLLTVASSIGPAIGRQTSRQDLRERPMASTEIDRDGADGSSLLWDVSLNVEGLAGRDLAVFGVAAVGDDPPRALGTSSVPGPGDAWVSPALGRLLSSSEGDEYRARIPGEVVGELSQEIVTAPGEFVMVIGIEPEVAGPGAVTLYDVPTEAAPEPIDIDDRQSLPAPAIAVGLLAGLFLLLPLAALFRAAVFMNAEHRVARSHALSLAGVTDREQRTMLAIETGILSGIGALCGVAFFGVVRKAMSGVSVGETAFFTSDFRPSTSFVFVAEIVVVPVLAAVAVAVGLVHRQRSVAASGNRKFVTLALGGLGLLVAESLGLGPGPTVSSTLGVAAVSVGGLGLLGAATAAVLTSLLTTQWGGAVRLGLSRARADRSGTARAIAAVALAAMSISASAIVLPSRASATSEQVASRRVRPDVHIIGEIPPGVISDALAGVAGVTIVPLAVMSVSNGLGPETWAATDPQTMSATLNGADLADLGYLNITELVPSFDSLPSGVTGRRSGYLVDTDGSLRAAIEVRAVVEQAVGVTTQIVSSHDKGFDSNSVRETKSRFRALMALLLGFSTVAYLVVAGDRIGGRAREHEFLTIIGVDVRTRQQALMVELGVPVLVALGLGSIGGGVLGVLLAQVSGDPIVVDPASAALTLMIYVLSIGVCTVALLSSTTIAETRRPQRWLTSD